MFTTCAVVFVTIGIITYIIYKIIEGVNYIKVISKIPGPKGLPIIGHTLEFQTSQEQIFAKLANYSRKYNGIYKLCGGNHAAVFISNPNDVEIVISGMRNLEKSQMYRLLKVWLGTGLLTSTDEKWHSRRKILTPSFHFNILHQFTPTFLEQSQKLIEELDDLVDKPINIVPLITKYTLLTICETAMGTIVHSQKFDKYREAIHKLGEYSIHFIVRPWYYSQATQIVSSYFYKSLILARFLHKFSKDVISKRQEGFNIDDMSNDTNNVYKKKKRLTLIDTLLYAKHVDNSIDDEGIREEVDTFMFEGHDTTSSCITFTLMLLACNKEVQDKAFDELNVLLPNQIDQLSFDIVNEMKYLERVIKESLRLYPSVPMFGRINDETIVTKDGYVILPLTNIMVRVYDLHRNPELYPNPEKFDPDRFLSENVKNRHPFAYIPFSAGPRNCIGQKFAMLELKSIVASILRRFQIIPVDTPETISLVTDLILHTKDGIRMKFSKRN